MSNLLTVSYCIVGQQVEGIILLTSLSPCYNYCIMQTPSDAVKKVPPPTKAKPKPPAAQEVVKKPVLPPNAALASSTLANVLKEGRKVSN